MRKERSLTSIVVGVACMLAAHAQQTGAVLTDSVRTEALPEVVVTGTGTEHLLRNAPVQTEIISRKMLNSYGGRSIEEILAGLTASFAFGEGDMGSQMQLGGLGNSYILILIDGKRIHGDVGGENDLGLIDPQNIERIEIVKGAQSALYGSDAMAGVVNIITKKVRGEHSSAKDEGLQIDNSTRYGSYNDLRQHNGVALALGPVTSYTNFQLQHTDGWQNTAEEYTEAQVITDSRNKTVNAYTLWQVAERLIYTPRKDLELYADGTYYTKSIHRPQDGHHPSCDVYTYDLMYRNASASTGGRWKPNDTDVVTLDIDWNRHAYYYAYTDTTLSDGYDPLGNFTNYYPYFPGQINLQSDQQRLMAHLKGVFALQASVLSVGAEYRYDYLNAPMRTATGTADDWTAALYAQNEWNPLAWLNITAGLRLNENGGFGFRATPKVSTMLSLGDFRVRAGWSQGFKTPTTKELHYRYLHTMGSSTFFNLGNTELKAQGSTYVSAGVEYRGERLTASVTGYRNRLDNMIALVNVPLSEIPHDVTSAYTGDGSSAIVARKYMNMEDARTLGVDVNLSYTFAEGLTAGGNYSWLDTQAHEYDTQHDRLEEVVIDGTAHHKWNAYLIWNHRFHKKYKLGANLSTRGSSRRYYQNNGDGAPFQLWRLNTTHDLGTAASHPFTYRIEAGVDNIFNYVDRTMHPYHLGTNSPGRTVYAALVVHFKQGKSVKPNKMSNLKSYENED
ncbi:MAG: TonB-dependent receptor [Bacteroidaceae bacterium]|nr:TonB-dependent receptor [Bacteroidaceae bacterium]